MKNNDEIIKGMNQEADELVLDTMTEKMDVVFQKMLELRDAINEVTAARTWASKRVTGNWHMNEDEDGIRHAFKDLNEILDIYDNHIEEAQDELGEDEDEEADVDDGE